MNKQELIKKYEKILINGKSDFKSAHIYQTFLRELRQLDEPHKVTIPQFVADWYEEHKDDFEIALFRCIDHIPSVYDEGDLNEFEEWIIDGETKPFQTLVNMHQFGYEVEKEKRYLVKMKGLRENTSYLNYDSIDAEWYFADAENGPTVGTHCTREELESAGFGWVFDCPGVEIEEVE